jgi:hypothetical protein
MVSTFASGLGYAEGVSVDELNNIYIEHRLNGVRKEIKCSAAGQVFWGFNCPSGFRDGAFTIALFGTLISPILMADGSLLYADVDNHRLRLLAFNIPPLLTVSPAGEKFTNSTKVALATPVPNGVIRYTLDGSLPTTKSPAYSAPIILAQSATVQAVVFVNNFAVTLPVRASYQKVSGSKDGIPVGWRDQYFFAQLNL